MSPSTCCNSWPASRSPPGSRCGRSAARCLNPGSSSRTRSCTAVRHTSSSTCSRCSCSDARSSSTGARVVSSSSTWCAGAAEEVIGASGGVFGVLLAFAWYFPRQRIILLFPPIPMPAWLFVTVYGLLELFLGVTGTQQGVAHFAHLGGMLGGALCILYWRARHRFSS